MMHPADRQPKAPTVNKAMLYAEGMKDGEPRAMPQKHGRSRRCVPIYFYTLANLK